MSQPVVLVQSASEKDDAVYDKISHIRYADEAHKKSSENRVRVRLGFFVVFVFLIMWWFMRVIINLWVHVIRWFLPELSFTWPEEEEKKTCSARLFGDRDAACQGTLEQPHHRFCSAHQAYRIRSCENYHLTQPWDQENHGSTEPIEMFVRRLNRSLVSFAELAMRREHASILRLSTDRGHRNWEWLMVQRVDRFLTTANHYPEIRVDAFKRHLSFFLEDLSNQVHREEAERDRHQGRMDMNNYVPIDVRNEQKNNGDEEIWD